MGTDWYVWLFFLMSGSCLGAMPKPVYHQNQQRLPKNIVNACWNGDEQAIGIFLCLGNSPDAIDSNGLTLLARACVRGNIKIVELLIDTKASLELVSAGKTPLMWASYSGHAPVVKVLAEQKISLETQDQDGNTALMIAAQEGESDCVDVLLRAGAKICAADKEGLNARKLARLNNHDEVIKLLKTHQKKRQQEFKKKQSVEKEGYELVPLLDDAALKELQAEKNAPTLWDWCAIQ